VAIVKASSYSEDLVKRMLEGIRACGLDVRGLRVLLKPNLVEFDPATCINTNVAMVAAAVEVFQTLGAAEVVIGEGPGHRRTRMRWRKWRVIAVKLPVSTGFSWT